jgi:lysozyme
MHLGKRGTALIQRYEKCSLKAYLPTPNDEWTIGWGHTGPDVYEGLLITLERANELFESDVRRFERVVNRVTAPLTQAMFDALCSLAFNTGTLGETIPLALNQGRYFDAWAGFALWRKQKGKDLLGLARRRAKEMVLFFQDGLPRKGV